MILTTPAGTWHHWAAYDIPSTLTALAERAVSDAEKRGFKQAVNEFQRAAYGGHAHRAAMGHVIIISLFFGCWRSRLIICRKPHAVLS
jgi:hypothetical protein